MAGVVFIVNVPKKDFELTLRSKDKHSKISVEKEKFENTRQLVCELTGNKRYGARKSSIESYAQDDHNVIINKCQPTDNLHIDKGSNLYRCKSEEIVGGNTITTITKNESESPIKSSWDGIKHVIKPRKKKLKITQPPRGVDILAAFQWDTPLEVILDEIVSRLDIKNAAWSSTRDGQFWQITFSLDSGNLCEELLQVLRTFGIGSRYLSSLSVIPCALYYKCANNGPVSPDRESELFQSVTNSAWSRLSSSVRSRNNIAKILHEVRSEATLTFDWLFLLIVAAFVAAIGLVENSTVILVASMLISPLMGPITAGTLGTAVNDRSLQRMGLIQEILGIFLSLIIGFLFGLIICGVDERYGVTNWPTDEMMSRCELRSLWVGILVAIPSGAGVALAVLGEYTASLVGVVISASLLPPAINAGLFWAMATVHHVHINDETPWSLATTSYYSDDPVKELALLGTVSLCLTLVNIVCIFVAGVLVYKIKEVCPLDRKDIPWWRVNKDSLTSTKLEKCEVPAGSCNTYSKLNNNVENEVHCEKKVSDVQSETVTYRKHNAGRLRAQNIEAYLNNAPTRDYNVLQTKLSYKSQEGVENSKHKLAETQQNDYKYSEEPFYPTIEPSTNFTLDSANVIGPVLGSKSFHV